MEMYLPNGIMPLAWLAGKWVTTGGHAEYPNMPRLEFHENLEFLCIGQPMLNYTLSSTSSVDQTPLHQERGFLRLKASTNEVAFIVSHSKGFTTLEEGHSHGDRKEIVLETVKIARMSFAEPPEVKKIRRVIKMVSPELLKMQLYMETEDTPMCAYRMAFYNRE